ncbi:MAG: dihydroorotase [Candidatus Neomarinimicrobiota bacterium]
MIINKLSENVFLKNGTIYDPFKQKNIKGNVLITNGRINGIGDVSVPDKTDVIDCSGLLITHGFCDLHAHFREPGREDKETLRSGAKAALAGGFTRVCVMPNTDPVLDDPESIRFIIDKADETPVHIHPIGAITKGQQGKEISEMGAMKSEGAVAFSDDGVPLQNAYVMRLALEYAGMIKAPIINHAEDIALRNDGVMNESIVSTKLGLSGNPDVAESTMIQRDLQIAQTTDSVLHIPHVTTKKGVDAIREYKSVFQKISAEVTPHHLYFNDEVLVNYNTNFKTAPPLRTENDRKALISALKEGVIDCIATDHAPHTIEEKEAPFELAPFGMIGLESCFGAVNKVLVNENGMKIESLIDLLTIKPRKIFGFEQDLFAKGTLAEITIFDPKASWVFTKDDIYSKSINSPYVGEELIGKIIYSIAKGSVAKI